MRPALDYSKNLRRMLADGQTLDEALADLRRAGSSIFDCIVSIQKLRKCEITEAKQIIEASAAWSDHHDVTGEILKASSESNGMKQT
jgi:hypothetical protein